MWGIYHIHLSNIEADSYGAMKSNRADKLLFAVIKEDDVYFIDIEKHNKEYVFSMFNLLKIIKNNWEFLLYEHKDIVDTVNAVYDDKTLYELFKANINYFIYKIEGKFYSIGLNGLTGAGTSMTNQLKFMELQRCLNKIYPKPPIYATQIKCTLKYSTDYFCDLDWMEGNIPQHFAIRSKNRN